MDTHFYETAKRRTASFNFRIVEVSLLHLKPNQQLASWIQVFARPQKLLASAAQQLIK